MFSMSVAQAIQFYGFLEDVFVEKLASSVEKRVRKQLAGQFDFHLSDEDYAAIANILKRKNAHSELGKIVYYMTGLNLDDVKRDDLDQPGMIYVSQLRREMSIPRR